MCAAEKKRTVEELGRYARQIALPEIGEAGQYRLKRSRVLLVGVGGLGVPVAQYLVASGVGCLAMVDDDLVDVSNLQRQVLYSTRDTGRSKVEIAAQVLNGLNPHVELHRHARRLDQALAEELIPQYDITVLAVDNFSTRETVAQACHHAGKPYCNGGITGFNGQVMFVIPPETACFGCLFENKPPISESHPAGPLGVVPGVIGTLMATEILKYLLKCGELLTDMVMTYDALTMQFRKVQVHKNPDCILCSQGIH